MRWVAFWGLLYVSVLEFVAAIFFFSAAWSKWDSPADGLGRGLFLLAIPCGLAATSLFLLLRHVWAYLLSVLLALALFGLAGELLREYFFGLRTMYGGRGVGLELGLVFGLPALLALIALLLPPTRQEVGLDAHFGRGE